MPFPSPVDRQLELKLSTVRKKEGEASGIEGGTLCWGEEHVVRTGSLKAFPSCILFHPHYFAKLSPDFLSFASFESASFLLLLSGHVGIT